MTTVRPVVGVAAAALAASLVVCGCPGLFGPAHGPAGDVGYVEIRVAWPSEPDPGAAPVSAKVIPAGTVTIRVIITGDGMSPIQTDIGQVDLVGGIASRRIPVPVGSARLIEARALDTSGNTLALGRTTADITSGAVSKVRVVLVAGDGSQPPPVVVSISYRLSGFDGNFIPSGPVTRQSVGALAAPPGSGDVAAEVTVDYFPEQPSGARPMVATMVIHNATELWLVRGFCLAPLQQNLDFQVGTQDGYITSPGGYTTDFQGSIISGDLVIGHILYPIVRPGHMGIVFGPPDPIHAIDVTGSVDVGAMQGRTLIGSIVGHIDL